MCGISGELRFDHRPAAAGEVDRMTARMASRGPDAGGLLVHDGVALGHRRLSIMDLSERAEQPMVDAYLGLSIAYNGAVYNHPELRKELEGLGYRFFSTGDTEVLLKAYHAWGEAFVDRLRGMFAFAIWDRNAGKLVLGRDPLGIKPLYYAEVDGALRFASTLPALLAGGGIDTEVDPVALNYYMSFHSVVPAPHTILKRVRKVPPGTLVVVDRNGQMRETRYWSLEFDESGAALPGPEWRERVHHALDIAVQRRLVADVPVGVLLSGGLDSSLVTGLLARNGATGLQTFSIGFESVNGIAGDEFRYSDAVVEAFGTEHHKIFVEGQRTIEHLPACVEAMSEPMVSHDVIGFYLLSREVSRHVKVVQSGQGADEVFAGYHWYPPLLEESASADTYRKLFCDRDKAAFERAVHPRFHGEDHSRVFVEQQFARPGARRTIDKGLRLDTTVMLVDDPVKRVDNMTMAFGLEARVPFLDRDLVELAARVPAELKVGGGGKGILKEVARGILPDVVIDRPKGYFPVPELTHIRGEHLDFVREILSQPSARERELFQGDYVAKLIANPDEHITPLGGSELWQIALLELWLQTHAA